MIRTIDLTLEEARDLYKGGFKDLALKFYTEKEILNPWESIKTFEDACRELNINPSEDLRSINSLSFEGSRTLLENQYKLLIINRALNFPWVPGLNKKETIYYPRLFWDSKDKWEKKEEGGLEIETGRFRDLGNGKIYVVNGACNSEEDYATGGLGDWDDELAEDDDFAAIDQDLSFFGFKSPEIANHFIKYFGRIAFDSVYGQFKQYEWL